MKVFNLTNVLIGAMTVSSLGVFAQVNLQPKLQNYRAPGYDGLNVFETKKGDSTEFDGVKVRLGGDFAIQYQAVDHSNDMNSMAPIGTNVNLPTANLNIDVQLAKGMRMHLRTYLSARHHNETWVKGGYLQLDDLDYVKKDFLSGVMDIASVRVGVDQLNYGDAHFRRSDNAMALYNPFVGNYLMDAFTVQPFAEVNVQPGNFIIVGGISNGILSPTVNTANVPRGGTKVVGEKENKITLYGKLGWDSQVNDDLRVRITGSFYSAAGYDNGTHLYAGDRAGGRYYNIFNNVSIDSTFNSGGDFSGRFNPSFKDNLSFQVNPFVKFKGFEFFGVFEMNTGTKVEGYENGAFTQLGAELLYRFGASEQFYVGGRYNSVSGNSDYKTGTTQKDAQKISRINVGAGWFMTKNVLMKMEYVTQSYNSNDENSSNAAWTGGSSYLSGANMNGVVVEAVINF